MPIHVDIRIDPRGKAAYKVMLPTQHDSTMSPLCAGWPVIARISCRWPIRAVEAIGGYQGCFRTHR